MLYVGTDLSYPEEQIVTGTPFELAKMEFAPLAVLLFENPNPEPEFTAGMADEVFLRDKVPMTKREVRNASLSHLQLSSNSVVYDIDRAQVLFRLRWRFVQHRERYMR